MPGEVARLLDEEHQGTLALLGAVEQAFGAARGDAPRDANVIRLAGRLRDHLLAHVPKHFGFEEQELFPRLAAAGEGDLCGLLHDEHVEIEAVAREFVPLAADVAALDPAGFDALRRLALELAERMRGHIDKETMSLVPLCDDHLAPDADQAIALAYASA